MYVTKVASEKQSILDNPTLKRQSAHLTLLQRKKASLRPTIDNSSSFARTPNNVTPRATQYEAQPLEGVSATTQTMTGNSGNDSDELLYEGDDEEDGKTTSNDVEMQDASSSPQFSKETIMSNLQMMDTNKQAKAQAILDTLTNNPSISLKGIEGLIIVDGEKSQIKTTPFLYNLQQPTKKLQPIEEYRAILSLLDIPASQVSNTYAKDILNQLRGEQTTRQTEQVPQETSFIEDIDQEGDNNEDGNEEQDNYFTLPRESKGWWSFK